jgi:hypothetical protein
MILRCPKELVVKKWADPIKGVVTDAKKN